VQRALLVFACGGAGCVARYVVNLAVGKRDFPYATLIVNLVGSFLIAFILELTLARKAVPGHVQLALTTGFLGGFTTYSSFNYETTRLLLDGAAVRGLVYLAVTVVGALACGLAGLAAARGLAG
jgi:fluoride exporter